MDFQAMDCNSQDNHPTPTSNHLYRKFYTEDIFNIYLFWYTYK